MDYAALSNNRCVSDQLWNVWTPGVFMHVHAYMLPATKRKSRTFATRETDVISERKHCSRRRRHTQVELSSSHKCADKTQTIARKCWHGARKRKRWNVRSTCGKMGDGTIWRKKKEEFSGSDRWPQEKVEDFCGRLHS